MRRALRDAGLAPAQIAYLHAHATSTPVGDRAEALAIHDVFTAAQARPVVASTKGLTGHGLSLAGAMETAFCALSLKAGILPGNHTLKNPDDACAGLDMPRATIERHARHALKNSSGFGGSNVTLVLRAAAS
jgi:3-oxoacyl-(acyl-carrier-protein) synthase